jgi:hypothetical protein
VLLKEISAIGAYVLDHEGASCDLALDLANIFVGLTQG